MYAESIMEDLQRPSVLTSQARVRCSTKEIERLG